MNLQEIDRQAQMALEKAEQSDGSGLTQQLNSMSPRERVTVARAMRSLSYQRRADDDSLPVVDITTGVDAHGDEVLLDVKSRQKRASFSPLRIWGDYDPAKPVYHSSLEQLPTSSIYAEYNLPSRHMTSMEIKSAEATIRTTYGPIHATSRESHRTDGSSWQRQYDPEGTLISDTTTFTDGPTITTDYNGSGQKISTDRVENNKRQHIEFDPASSKRKAVEWTWEDGAVSRHEYDPDTQNLLTLSVKQPGGKSVLITFDAETGRKQSHEEKNADGSVERITFDPATGKMKSKEVTVPGESSDYREYDPATGKLSIKRIEQSGRSVQELKYDPKTEKLVAKRIELPDGMIQEYKYDTLTGNPRSLDVTKPNEPKEHIEYDTVTRKPKSKDVTFPSGDVKHYQFDLTGNPKSADAQRVRGHWLP